MGRERTRAAPLLLLSVKTEFISAKQESSYLSQRYKKVRWMDQGCRGRGPCLCLAATPTQLITLLFIPNNVVAVSGGWRRSRSSSPGEAGWDPKASERASGFKRYSLSFLMEKNRKWGCEAGFCDLYAAVAGGEKSKSISLSAPLVCSPILPFRYSRLLRNTTKIHFCSPLLGNRGGFALEGH